MKVTVSFERKTAAQQGGTAISEIHVSVKDAHGHLTHENVIAPGGVSSTTFELPEEYGRAGRIEIATTCIK
jgi:hypothetical protein